MTRQRRRHSSYRQHRKSCSPTTRESIAGQKQEPHDLPLASDFFLTSYFPCCSFSKHIPHFPAEQAQSAEWPVWRFFSLHAREDFILLRFMGVPVTSSSTGATEITQVEQKHEIRQTFEVCLPQTGFPYKTHMLS